MFQSAYYFNLWLIAPQNNLTGHDIILTRNQNIASRLKITKSASNRPINNVIEGIIIFPFLKY